MLEDMKCCEKMSYSYTKEHHINIRPLVGAQIPLIYNNTLHSAAAASCKIVWPVENTTVHLPLTTMCERQTENFRPKLSVQSTKITLGKALSSS